MTIRRVKPFLWTYIDETTLTDGRLRPPDDIRLHHKPWPQRFVVTHHMLMQDAFEVRPLTVTALIKGIVGNFVAMNYWRVLRVLRRLGFLTTEPACELSLRDWCWAFWRTPSG